MQRHEYKVIVSADDDDTDERLLNELGADGWELVSAVADVRAGEENEDNRHSERFDPDSEGTIPVTVFYLKRSF